MRKINVLTAMVVVGFMLGGCAELKLPELPKVKKEDNKKTKASDCKEIIKKYKQLRKQGYVGNEPSLGRDYATEAHYCELESNNSDIDIEKIMEINK